MRRFATSLGSLALALTVGASAATAQTASSSRAAFEAALSSFTVEGFEGIAPPGGFVDFVMGPFTAGPFTISTTNPTSELFVIDDAFAGGAFSLGSGDTFSPQLFGAGSNDVDVTTGSPIKAFGFDFGVAQAPTTFSLFLDGTFFQSFSYTGTLPSPDFFGVISSTPFTTVTIHADSDVPIYDNFTVGTPNVSPVPEPATVALVGGGLLLLGAAARRRTQTT